MGMGVGISACVRVEMSGPKHGGSPSFCYWVQNPPMRAAYGPRSIPASIMPPYLIDATAPAGLAAVQVAAPAECAALGAPGGRVRLAKARVGRLHPWPLGPPLIACCSLQGSSHKKARARLQWGTWGPFIPAEGCLGRPCVCCSYFLRR